MGGRLIPRIAVIVAIVLFVCAYASPRVGSQRTAPRLACFSNMRQIGLALQAYRADHQAFPPAYTVDEHGKPLHSWRTLLLPYLDNDFLYKQINHSKPWNDPVNQSWKEIWLPIYSCPNSSRRKSPLTTYQILVGQDACLSPTIPRDDSEATSPPDKTLILIEVSTDKAVHWMEPTDHAVDYLLAPGPLANVPHQGGINVIYLDGRGEFLPTDTPLEVRQELISITKEQKPAVERFQNRK